MSKPDKAVNVQGFLAVVHKQPPITKAQMQHHHTIRSRRPEPEHGRRRRELHVRPIRRRLLPLCPRLNPKLTKQARTPIEQSFMEGLIPFIYKAIKERRTRSYSRCSSASERGAVAGEDDVWEQKQQWKNAEGREAGAGHRRHRSLEELAGEVGAAAPEWRAGAAMRRGRSARIFSCIGGM